MARISLYLLVLPIMLGSLVISIIVVFPMLTFWFWHSMVAVSSNQGVLPGLHGALLYWVYCLALLSPIACGIILSLLIRRYL